MNLDNDLRRDKFLFPDDDNFGDKTYKNHNAYIMVGHLNRQGIYTIGELINSNITSFGRNNKHFYKAVIRILRHMYLGEELLIDVVLENCYDTSDNYDISRKELADDLKWLGFGRTITDCQTYAASFLKIHNGDRKITMEDCLLDDRITLDNPGSCNLRGFYQDYIKEKREKNLLNTSVPTSVILENLKLQLVGLKAMRDGLNNQITALENMINSYYVTPEVKDEPIKQVKKRGRKRSTDR